MFSIDKADSGREVDRRLDVSAARDSFPGHLGEVSDLGEVGVDATNAVRRLIQDVHDCVN